MIQYRRLLPDLMKELDLPMTAVEVGVAEGLFSNDLLTNGVETLYLVDIWQHENVSGDGSNNDEWHNKNYTDAKERLKKFGDRALFMKGFSKDMALQVPDNSLGLVYLDAGHSYQDVMLDLQVWFPKLVKGGICAGHDYINTVYGVNQAVSDFTSGRFKVFTIREDKDEDAGFIFIKP